MNRCLHITLNEGSGRTRRTPATFSPGQARTDPGSNYVMPDPDDPSTNYVMPDPDDPSSGPWVSGGSGGCGAVVATACSCCCGSGGQATVAPGTATAAPNPFVTARDYSGFVIVRLAPGVESTTAPTLWNLADELKLAGLKAVLERPEETDANARRPAPPDVTD